MGERLNLDGKTLNFDGGTLTLDGETRPPASTFYNLSTGYSILVAGLKPRNKWFQTIRFVNAVFYKKFYL